MADYETNRRKELRIAKGRPRYRTLYTQHHYRDGQIAKIDRDVIAPDPILGLHGARIWALTGEPRANVRYGELVQRVVSPLDRRLP